MPTGYTADIKDGISFNQFIMQCARAFGACIMMRDDPSGIEIPERFEPSDYNIKALKEAKERLKQLRATTIEDANIMADEEYRLKLVEREKRIREINDQRQKYKAMLSKAKAWTPPTSDHQGLRDFMVEQIESSIDFDCSTSYLTLPELLSGIDWLNEKTQKALRDIEYHAKENEEEIERTEGRNKWIRDLRQSLES